MTCSWASCRCVCGAGARFRGVRLVDVQKPSGTPAFASSSALSLAFGRPDGRFGKSIDLRVARQGASLMLLLSLVNAHLQIEVTLGPPSPAVDEQTFSSSVADGGAAAAAAATSNRLPLELGLLQVMSVYQGPL
jgi:hypothetical protein